MAEPNTAPSTPGACLWHPERWGGEEGETTLAGFPSPHWEATLVEGEGCGLKTPAMSKVVF